MALSTFTANDLISLTASGSPDRQSGVRVNVGAAHEPRFVSDSMLAADLANGTYGWVQQRSYFTRTGWQEAVQFTRTAVGPLRYHYDGGRKSALYSTGTDVAVGLVWDANWEEFDIAVAGKSEATVQRIMSGFARLFPSPPPPPPAPPRPDNVIPVAFWMQDVRTREAYSRRRDITVHKWSEVQANYPKQVRDQAGPLVKMGAPTTEGSGKLLLLHGPPGCGKSRFILTLLSEWRDWCAASVVTDSDRFFGDATYLNSIVFGANGMRDWLLLVVEDGDDYLNVDARSSKGQAIARLLNIGDGIVGQGINLLTLLTTNVPMDQLNPAIVRPGRALANIHFGPFTAAEASQWCAERGKVTDFEEDDVTLAEMYARLRGSDS